MVTVRADGKAGRYAKSQNTCRKIHRTIATPRIWSVVPVAVLCRDFRVTLPIPGMLKNDGMMTGESKINKKMVSLSAFRGRIAGLLSAVALLGSSAAPAQEPLRESPQGAQQSAAQETRHAASHGSLQDTLQVGGVTVVGKGRSQQLREGAFAVGAVDVRGKAVQTLDELVNRSSGVRIRETGGMGSDFELSLNGMSGNSVRYFIDGVPLEVRGGEVNLANLPVSTIERVEIYKGVVPAHLGADALGGAINIITRQQRSDFLDASAGYGSFGTWIGDLNGRLCLPRGVVIRPSVGVNSARNDYKMRGIELWDPEREQYVKRTVRRFHDDYLSVNGQLEVGVEGRRWADQFYVTGGWAKVDKELQTGSVQSVVYGAAERRQEAWNAGLRYRKRFGERWLVNLAASHTFDASRTIDTAFRRYAWDGSWKETQRSEITGRDRSLRHYRRPLTVVRANFNYDINSRHALNLNYLLSRSGNSRTDEADPSFDPSNDVLAKHILGLSYNGQHLDGRMVNTIFVKDYISVVDIEQRDRSFVTHADEQPAHAVRNYIGYGLGSRFTVREPLALKLSFEHTVRLPLARELLGNGTNVYANLALRPESSDNVNVGVFGTWRPAAAHMLAYEASLFYRDVKDYIHVRVSEADGTMQYENVSKVRMKGAEAELRYVCDDRLRVVVNASWQEARDMNRLKADGKPSITYRNRVPNAPWLYGNVEVAYTTRPLSRRGDRLRAEYAWQYVHWFYLTWEGIGSDKTRSRIPTQHQQSLALTWSWHEGRYSLTAECRNLFDRLLYDNFMLQKPGRSFFCKFRLYLYRNNK